MSISAWMQTPLGSQPWTLTALSAVAASLIALLAHSIGYRLSRRLFHISTLPGLMLRRCAKAARIVLLLLALQIVWRGAHDDLPGIATLRHLNSVLLIVALTVLALRATSSVNHAIEQRYPIDAADNLRARGVRTQTRVLTRTLMFLFALLGLSTALMTFPGVRQIGTSLLASAGIAGLVVGLAAKPILGNLLAGLQLALTQPLRIDDVLIVEGEWGRVEEITGAYVVIRIWDDRRLIVPLQWFIEHPFQNWTRRNAQLIGSVFLWVDYRLPLEPLRAELQRVCAAAPEWDGRLALLQVTDSDAHGMQLRALVTSADSSLNWDLRCRVREALIDFVQRDYPDYLPQLRARLQAPARPDAAP